MLDKDNKHAGSSFDGFLKEEGVETKFSSHYGKFIKEREGKEIIENDYGFCSYSLTPDGIYIENIFILQPFRKSGLAVEFEREVTKIAKEKGLKYLYSSVATNTVGATNNLNTMINHGARLHSANNSIIFVVKDVL